ncbi:hypothetical protein BH11BAC2_BH11BAC2_12880 [soil metagenome]
MNFKKLILALSLLIAVHTSKAQDLFDVSLVPTTITDLPGAHSFAFGKWDGKWIIIGGRLNGLHGFQPPFGFPFNSANSQIYIIDPDFQQVWDTTTSNLSQELIDHVSSSAFEFVQRDSMLYIMGGYGYNTNLNSFITFPNLTAVNLSSLVNAVINQGDISPSFRQLTDSNLLVAGGHAAWMDSTCYLVFGHRFDGRYDKQDTTGFFVQEYTHQIRMFQINDDGVNLSLSNYATLTDTANFRRRDYNLIPQIFPDGSSGLTAFSGVFRENMNLPYFHPVNIHAGTYEVDTVFNQYLNHYDSGVMPIYDANFNAMHNVFFGGMAMYTYDTLTNTYPVDSLIPFVKTISRVTRWANGAVSEIKLPVEMPSLQGTNALFIPDPAIPLINNEIINLNLLPSGSVRAGFLLGGIESPLNNISDIDPSLTWAVSTLYEVYINKQSSTGLTSLGNEKISAQLTPNPASSETQLEIHFAHSGFLHAELRDITGRVIKVICHKKIGEGGHVFRIDLADLAPGMYAVNCELDGNYTSLKLIKD